LAFNVLGKNAQHDRVVRYLREQSADLVLLMEVNDAWASTVANLKDLYPQQHVVARDDNFGIALLSRVAWRNIATLELGEANVPSIVAQFDFPPGACTLIGTHPLPPGSHRLAELRNEQLHELAQLAHQLPGPVVLAGDLNTTSYSPYFSDLLSSSGLRDSRQGRGIQASWGPLPFFEIAIDHCLVSADVAVLERHVGPHLGSDHRPVLVELGFTQANREVLPPR
jgi:endonuclease/exonuclease/phosphatase (EEP) superfamily protein YafD